MTKTIDPNIVLKLPERKLGIRLEILKHHPALNLEFGDPIVQILRISDVLLKLEE